MCPEEKCSKKVIDENNGTYRCEKCNKIYNDFKWAYMISVCIFSKQLNDIRFIDVKIFEKQSKIYNIIRFRSSIREMK